MTKALKYSLPALETMLGFAVCKVCLFRCQGCCSSLRSRFAPARSREPVELRRRRNPDLRLVPRADPLLSQVQDGAGRPQVEGGRRFRQVLRVEGQPGGDKEVSCAGNGR